MNHQGLNRRKFLRLGGAVAATGALISSTYGTPFINDFEEKIKNEEEIKMRFFSNENPYGPSKKVKKSISNQLYRVNRYATYHEYDTNALKALIAKKNNIGTDQIIFGHGSFQILCMMARAFGKQKNSIIVPGLTFNITGRLADRIFDHKSKVIPVTNQLDIDLAATKRAVTKSTQLVYLCNPNNPTGKCLPVSDLERFCKEISSETCTVAIDEAYIELVAPSERPKTIKLLQEKYNVLIIRTFSKAYGLAGMRIGYAMGLPATIKKMESQHFGYNGLLNTLGTTAAYTALNDNTYVEEYRKKNENVKAYVENYFKNNGIEYIPSNTNFIFFKVNDFKRYKKDLENGGISPAVGGWPGFSEWSRVSIQSMEEMKKYIKVLGSMNWLIS